MKKTSSNNQNISLKYNKSIQTHQTGEENLDLFVTARNKEINYSRGEELTLQIAQNQRLKNIETKAPEKEAI